MKKLNIKKYKINHIFEKIKKCKGTIKINSKEINKGDIFISLKGSKDHGEKYINDAIETYPNGANPAACTAFFSSFT